MKPFKINRNSWHYKLNAKFLNGYGPNDYLMQERWEPKHNNFCAYWRVTMLRLLLAVGLAIILATVGWMLLSVMYSIGWLLYTDPILTLKALGMVVIIVAIAVGTIKSIVSISARRSNKPVKNPSLFAQRYRVYKEKVCPMVEYDD